jgi:hypothetical protein
VVGRRNAYGDLYEKHRRLDALIARASGLVSDAQKFHCYAKTQEHIDLINDQISQLRIEVDEIHNK